MTLRSVRGPLSAFVAVVCLVVGLGCLARSTAEEKRQAFGPEWKKVDPKSDWARIGFDYERTVSVTFRHSPSNVAGFEVPLECGDRLWGYEVDDNTGSA